ncbi:hypothetical protein DIPPA_22367 [Diplonema papillatum]|nr:hypothetical protein DIPPA_22367 [Diplonema papillatum]
MRRQGCKWSLRLTFLAVFALVVAGWLTFLIEFQEHTGQEARRLSKFTELKKLGNCYYKQVPDSGGLCVEGGRVVLYNAGRDQENEQYTLCTGFPQKQPEGTQVIVKASSKSHRQEANGVELYREERGTALFITLTLENNLFHVLRDTVANLMDMLTAEKQQRPDVVFLLPKHPAFAKTDFDGFHILLAGLTGGGPDDWKTRIITVQDVPKNTRICVERAYVGQVFNGYTKGSRGRMALYKRWVWDALQVVPPLRLLHGEKYKMLVIDRASKNEDVNRRLGNVEEIAGQHSICKTQSMFDVTERYVFQKHTVLEQLRTAASTDLMMGTHGQALSWCAFMRDGSVCFEIGIWEKHREDYPLISKWSNVYAVFVGLKDPSQVKFSLNPDMSDAEKRQINYYRPFTNYKHRQNQIVYPNIPEICSQLERSYQLLRVKDANQPNG